MPGIKVAEVYADFRITGVSDEINRLRNELRGLGVKTGVAQTAKKEGEEFKSIWSGVFDWFKHSWKYFVVSAVWIGLFQMMYSWDRFKESIMNTLITLEKFAEQSTKMFADVQYNIKLAAVQAGANAKELEEAVKRVSLAFGFTQEELSNVALQMARMGVEGKDLAKMLEIVAKAAISTGEDMETLAGYIIGMATTFGESYDEIANKLVMAGNVARATTQQVGYSLAFIGQFAKEVGLSFEEAAGWAVYLNNLGNSMYRVAFWMRNAMMQLIEGDRGVIRFFQDLGISIRDTSKPLQSFDQILDRIRLSIRTLPVEEAKERLAEFAKSIGLELGKIDMSKMWIELKKALERLPLDITKQKIKEIANLFGVEIPNKYKSAADMFDYLRMSVSETADNVEKLKAVLKSMGVEVKKELPPLNDMMKRIAVAILEGFKSGKLTVKDVEDRFRQLGLAIDLSGGKLKNMLELIAELREKIKKGEITFDELKARMTDAFGVGAEALLPLINMTDKEWKRFHDIIAKIGSSAKKSLDETTNEVERLNSAIYVVNTNLEDTTSLLDKQASEMTKTAKITMDRVRAMWQELQIRVGEAVAPVLGKILDAISNVVDEYGDKIAQIFGIVADSIGEILGSIDTSGLDNLLDAIAQLATAFMDVLAPVITMLVNKLMPVLTELVEAFVDVIIENKDDIISLFTTLTEIIVDNKEQLAAFVKDVLFVIVKLLEWYISSIGSLIDEIGTLEEILSSIREIIAPFVPQLEAIGESIASLSKTVTNFMVPLELLAAMFDLITGKTDAARAHLLKIYTTMSGIYKPLISLIQGIESSFTGAINNMIAFAQVGFSKIYAIYVGVMNSIINATVGAVNRVISVVRSMVSSIISTIRGLWDALTRHSVWTDMWKDVLANTKYYTRKNLDVIESMANGIVGVMSLTPDTVNTLGSGYSQAGMSPVEKTTNITVTISVDTLSLKSVEDIDELAKVISEKIKEEVAEHGL